MHSYHATESEFSENRELKRYRRDQSCHIADARHKAADHSPSKITAVNSRGLVDDGPYSFSSNDAPNEEGDSSSGRYDCLDCEQMTAGPRITAGMC